MCLTEPTMRFKAYRDNTTIMCFLFLLIRAFFDPMLLLSMEGYRIDHSQFTWLASTLDRVWIMIPFFRTHDTQFNLDFFKSKVGKSKKIT